MNNPFEWSNNICSSTVDIWDDESESGYAPFMINRSLSYHHDTVMLAQEMNQYQDLPKKMQYDFLRLAVKPKKKRFSKWFKPEKELAVEQLANWLKISPDRAREYLSLLTTEEIDSILEKFKTGGRNAR